MLKDPCEDIELTWKIQANLSPGQLISNLNSLLLCNVICSQVPEIDIFGGWWLFFCLPKDYTKISESKANLRSVIFGIIVTIWCKIESVSSFLSEMIIKYGQKYN